MSSAARASGIGRVLVLVYAILAIGATGRSAFQIATKFDEAPLAYTLSAVAAVVYIVATVALIVPRPAWRVVAWATICFELVGVLVVGALGLAQPELFGHPSVWSGFGSGYVFIPLVLPVLGLLWLARTRPRDGGADAGDGSTGDGADAADPRSASGTVSA